MKWKSVGKKALAVDQPRSNKQTRDTTRHVRNLAQEPTMVAFLEQYESLDVIGNGSFGIIRKVRRILDGQVFSMFIFCGPRVF